MKHWQDNRIPAQTRNSTRQGHDRLGRTATENRETEEAKTGCSSRRSYRQQHGWINTEVPRAEDVLKAVDGGLHVVQVAEKLLPE